jgi:hypothetical protein
VVLGGVIAYANAVKQAVLVASQGCFLHALSIAGFEGKVKGFHPAVTKRNTVPGVVVHAYHHPGR